MAKKDKPIIQDHPDRKKIEAAIIKQVPYRDIAAQYGMSIAAISRYVRGAFAPKVAKELLKQDEKDQQWIVKELTEILESSKQLQRAVIDELRDPTDKSKFYIGPRAYDVDVVYRTKSGIQKKAKLQTLLDRINKNDMLITDAETKIADPRIMHIRNSEALVKEIESIAKILGKVKDITINVTQTEEWTIIKQVIVQATQNAPEVRNQIVDALERIDSGS